MQEKKKGKLQRWLGGCLSAAMIFTSVFSQPFVMTSLAADGGEDFQASASDAVRDSRIQVKNKEKEDVQISVLSDNAGYEAGETVCLELYIKNNTSQAVTDGVLSYSGKGILEDSAYFEDLSDLYSEGVNPEEDMQGAGQEAEEAAGQKGTAGKDAAAGSETEAGKAGQESDAAGQEAQKQEADEAGQEVQSPEAENQEAVPERAMADGEALTEDREEAAEKNEEEGEQELAMADEADQEEMDAEDGEEDAEEEDLKRLTDLTIEPGQGYYVNFYYTIDDEIQGAKSQKINFTFKGRQEEKRLSAKESFRYTIGAMNLLPAVFTSEGHDEGQISAGDENELRLAFDLGDLKEIIEEAQENPSGEKQASPSDGEDGKAASASNAGKASSSNAWVKWEDEGSQLFAKKDERPLISQLNIQVEAYGLHINDFKTVELEQEEADMAVTGKFRISPKTRPGNYYGKATASYKYRGKNFQTTQGFLVEVVREAETEEENLITLKGRLDGTEVIVTGPAESFPEADELALQVKWADEEQTMLVEEALKKKSEEEGTAVKDYRAFDIKLVADGEETEPVGNIQVTFKNVKLENREEGIALASEEAEETAAEPAEGSGEEEKEAAEEEAEAIQVFHLDEEAAEIEAMKATTEENGDVVMETNHFSVYVLVLGDSSADGYDVTFEHWVETETEGTYEKRYKDTKPKDKDGNPIKLGGSSGQANIMNFVMQNDGYEVDRIEVFNADTGETRTYGNDKESDDQVNIDIRNDSIVRIYYGNKTDDVEHPVTFYDYDIGGYWSWNQYQYQDYSDGNHGINQDGNYENSGAKMTVGLNSRGGLTMGNNVYLNWNNADVNNRWFGGNPGVPIVQGIVTRFNESEGRLEFNDRISEPGFFTNDPADGKTIYSTSWSKEAPQLKFSKKGDTYELTSALFDDGEQMAGAGRKDFFPLVGVGESNRSSYGGDNNDKNWYFGMRYEFKFSLGDYIGPLIYEFTGDDDLWVFLDDKLILDLGGMHSAYKTAYEQGGEHNGEGALEWDTKVNLWYFLNDDEATCNGRNEHKDADAKYDENIQYDVNKEHTIRVFYMERGGVNSTCAMKFTIPGLTPLEVQPSPVPDVEPTAISVTKIWNDENDIDQNRPQNVTMGLYFKKHNNPDDEWQPYLEKGKHKTLTLNGVQGSNKWSGIFGDLPSRVEMAGQIFDVDYNVFEMNNTEKVEQDGKLPGVNTNLDFYTVSYSKSPGDEDKIPPEVTVTNTYIPMLELKVVKELEDIGLYPEAEVSKVRFKLTRTDETSIILEENVVQDESNKKKGEISFKIRPQEGTYSLEELTTAEGYKGLSGPISIEVKQDDSGNWILEATPTDEDNGNVKVNSNQLEISVTNRAIYTAILPDTGGPGVGLIKEYGWMLLLLALMMAGMEVQYYGSQRRKRKVEV